MNLKNALRYALWCTLALVIGGLIAVIYNYEKTILGYAKEIFGSKIFWSGVIIVEIGVILFLLHDKIRSLWVNWRLPKDDSTALKTRLAQMDRPYEEILSSTQTEKETPESFEHFNHRLFWITVGILVALTVISFAIEHKYKMEDLGSIVLFLAVVYIFLSLKTVNPDEVAAIIIFGKPIETVRAGLVFVPWGIIRLEKESGLIQENEFPAEPELIWRGKNGDDKALPPSSKYRPPIRILFGPPDPNDKSLTDNPYNTQMSAEVAFFISYQVVDMTKKLTVIGDKKKVLKSLGDLGESLLNAEFTKKSPAAVNRDIELHSENLREVVEKAVETWGIQIRQARFKSIAFSHDLNIAVVGVAIARETARTTIIDSEATKTKLTNEGQGTANARRDLLKAEATGRQNFLEAEAVGFGKKAEEFQKPGGREVLQLETVRTGLDKAHVTILTGGDSLTQSLVGVVQTLKTSTKEKEGTDA